MTLSKSVVVDQVTIVENGTVLYREAIRFFEDGAQVSQTFLRNNLQPGQDLTGIPDKVVAICNAIWTPEVVSTYKASLQQNPN
jgi:hypothetical protein